MQRSAALTCNAAVSAKHDYDLVIIGCGVGGHGAAIHAVECVRAHHQPYVQLHAVFTCIVHYRA